MNKGRAYSLIEIKAVEEDDDYGVITGIASTPTPDRVDDVVVPEGATFKLPLPLLWQHDSHSPIGEVTEAKVTKDGIKITARVAKGVSAEIDRAWLLIKAKLVRGLSIGFRGIEVAAIEGTWGVKYLKWEWLELSAVTIAANAEATIQTVKSVDTGIRAALGIKDEEPTPPGVSGKAKVVTVRNDTTSTSKGKKPGSNNMPAKSIAEQLAAFKETLTSKSARMDAIMEGAAERGETLNAEESDEFDTIESEVKALETHIKRLERMNGVKAATAAPVAGANAADASAARGGTVAPTVKSTEKVAPGIKFARLTRVKWHAKNNSIDVGRMAELMYPNDEELVNTAKAAVAAMTTGNSAWLVGQESRIFADFVEFLRPTTILGKFGTNGIPSLRSVPFRTALVGQTSGGSGYWVGEGKAKPLTRFGGERNTLEPLKVANICVVTKELLNNSSPSAEALVRDELAAALRERLDRDFINPAKTAVAGISPASITNGIAAIPSTGGNADGIRADIENLMQAFIAANNAPTQGVWIMSSMTALALSLMMNPLGQSEFPGVNMNGGMFFGLPVIVSEYVPTITGGAYVVLANASDIYLADEGGIDIDVSTEASLEMNDAPTHNSDSPTGTSLVSLWQTNSVGFLAERAINWSRRRDSGVQLLSGVNWSPSAT